MADFKELNDFLDEKEKTAAELTTGEKLARFGLAMKFFGSAFTQFAGGESTDPSIAAHKEAIARTKKASVDIASQVEGATKITEHIQKFVAPEQQIEAISSLAQSASPDDIPMLRQAALALQNPQGIAEVQAGAGVIAKLSEIKAQAAAMQDPEVQKAMGITAAQSKKMLGLFDMEGNLTQIAVEANRLGKDNPLFISDEQLLTLQTDEKVAAQATQVLGAQPVAAFEAGEAAAATEAAKDTKAKVSASFDETGQIKPAALNRVQKTVAAIMGAGGIEFGPQGEMRILDPQVGLDLARITEASIGLMKSEKLGIQEAVNKAAEAEGFDVSGKKAAGIAIQTEQTQQIVNLAKQRLDAGDDLDEILKVLRETGQDAAAQAVEEEFGGAITRAGSALKGIF